MKTGYTKYNEKKQLNSAPLTYEGKEPPSAIELEEIVLGTCMSYTDAVGETKLTPEMFYRESNQKIFAAILDLSKKGSCDLFSVTNHLQKTGELDNVGGILALTQMTGKIYSDQLIGNHSLAVKQSYLLREYIKTGLQIANMSYTEDLSDVKDFAETNLIRLSDISQSKDPRHIIQCIDECLIKMEKIQKREISYNGIPSGLSSLDSITGGWQKQNLIIVAGRPSMGKTAIALSFSKGAAMQSNAVAIFSMEMSDEEIATRYLSSVSGKTNMELRNGKVDFTQLGRISNEIAGLKIFIDDSPCLSLLELRSKVKKLILKHGVKLVIIDYLQLMKADAGSREQEVSTISRGLKALAKELDLSIIALSQLNRGVEDRTDKRPRLSDLRESGAIEQDADLVCLINRPAYYNIPTAMVNGEEFGSNGLMLLDIVKNRNGACFTIPVWHNEALTVIKDFNFNESGY